LGKPFTFIGSGVPPETGTRRSPFIAWERIMREEQKSAHSTIRRRLSALSSPGC
jgi:hypothetical protein